MAKKPTYDELRLRVQELEKADSENQWLLKVLREKIVQQKTLMDISLDGIAIIDQDHRVREANNRFAQMLGYSMQEVLQLHTWDWEAIMPEEEIRVNFADLTKTKVTFETKHRRSDGTFYDAEVTASGAKFDQGIMVMAITRDITNRKNAEKALLAEKNKLQEALAEVKKLSGMLPICSSCKKIRDDNGYWNQIENYIRDHSEVNFSHGICPECAKKLYPKIDIKDE